MAPPPRFRQRRARQVRARCGRSGNPRRGGGRGCKAGYPLRSRQVHPGFRDHSSATWRAAVCPRIPHDMFGGQRAAHDSRWRSTLLHRMSRRVRPDLVVTPYRVRGVPEIPPPLSARDLEQEYSEEFVLEDKLPPAPLRGWRSLLLHRMSRRAATRAGRAKEEEPLGQRQWPPLLSQAFSAQVIFVQTVGQVPPNV